MRNDQEVLHAVAEPLSHLVAAAHYYCVAQARQEAVAQRLAAATTTAHRSSQRIDPPPATPPSSSSSAGLARVAPVKRRLDESLARADRSSLTAGTPSGKAARTPLSSGRQPSLACGRKSMASKFSISCADDNKENSPALGKVATPSLGQAKFASTQTSRTALLHKAATLASSWVSPQQALDSSPQKPAQLSAYSKASHRSPLAPMTGVLDPTPSMTPHALQFHVVTMPFWGLKAGVPEVAVTEGVPIAAAPIPAAPTPASHTTAAPTTAALHTTAALPTTAAPPTLAAPTSVATRTPAAPPSPAAAGLTPAMLRTASESQASKMTLPTDAEQADAASVQTVSHDLGLPAALSDKRAVQGEPSASVHGAAVAASRLSPPVASSNVTTGPQITTGRQSTTDSLSAGIIAGAARQTQSRGSKRRTASAAAPAASQMVTRSQAAAQKHVERMQTRSRQSNRSS